MHTSEKIFLETILRDTTSRSICHLDGFFLFNLPERSFGSLILVKNGKRNIFLREATGHVYEAKSTPKGPILQRIDSSRHIGGNFRMMALERKDTLYQYGGYGFWRSRDFFTRYNPEKHDWEFMPSGRSVPAEYRLHHYDAYEDALYMVGGTITDSHLYNAFPPSDSVYRYLFKERTWLSIGTIRAEHADAVKVKFFSMNHLFVATAFGVLQLSETFSLMDFKDNRVLRPDNRSNDRIKELTDLLLSAEVNHSVVFQLNDTLHAIVTKGDSVRSLAIPLAVSDFDVSSSVPLYDPAVEPSHSAMSKAARLAVASIAVALIAYLTRRPKTNTIQKKEGPFRPGMSNDAGIESPDMSENGIFLQKAARFLGFLSHTEKELLKKIMLLSVQGRSMDIETFNKSIGVAQKDEGVKKTRRSLHISNINNAFALTMQSKGELIVRIRDNEDRRSKRYLVQEEHLSTLQSIFESKLDG